MTMAALLSHFGINTTRYVTTAGQVVFDGVNATGIGFVHATHGVVTPVVAHTFHGGEEDSDSADQDDGREPSDWWEAPVRLQRHIDAMTQSFPGFEYVPAEGDFGPAWRGVIDTGRGRFKVDIFTRHDQGLPIIKVLDRKLGTTAGGLWIASPHLYSNGNLCVADRDDWHPEEHTVATAAGWAAHWLAAYTEWWFSRCWPAEGTQAVAS